MGFCTHNFVCFFIFCPPPSRKSVKILPPLDKTEMTSLLYVCVFVFVCLHACMFCVCVCVCLLICVHVCLFVCACLCVYVCVTAVYPRVSVSKDSDTCTQFDHTVGQGGTSQDHRPWRYIGLHYPSVVSTVGRAVHIVYNYAHRHAGRLPPRLCYWSGSGTSFQFFQGGAIFWPIS